MFFLISSDLVSDLISSHHGRVTVQGGITYTQLARYLATTRWALENTASLLHFTVAGSLRCGGCVVTIMG
jgi:hypothetical protein